MCEDGQLAHLGYDLIIFFYFCICSFLFSFILLMIKHVPFGVYSERLGLGLGYKLMYEDGQLAHLGYDLILFFLHFFFLFLFPPFFVRLYIISDKPCLSLGPFRDANL